LRGVDYPNAVLKIPNPMIKQSEPYIISISGDPNIKVPKSELTDTNTKEEINSRREEEYPNTNRNHGSDPRMNNPIQLHQSNTTSRDLTIPKIVEQ
jgi:hypothetical protein